MASAWNPALRPNTDAGDKHAPIVEEGADINNSLENLPTNNFISAAADPKKDSKHETIGDALRIPESAAAASKEPLLQSSRPDVNEQEAPEPSYPITTDPVMNASEAQTNDPEPILLVEEDGLRDGIVGGLDLACDQLNEENMELDAKDDAPSGEPLQKLGKNTRTSAQKPGKIDQIDEAFDAVAEDAMDAFSPGAPSPSRSFPEVPSLLEEREGAPRQLPHSQAEDIIEEEENAIAQGMPSLHNLETLSGVATPVDNAGNDHDDLLVGEGLAQTAPQPIFEDDDRIRFEEGLPLIPQATNEAILFRDDDVDDEDAAFFEKSTDILRESPAPRPQTLDRKTTIQVLGSIDNDESKSDPILQDRYSKETPAGDVVEGGIAVSTETVKSPILAKQSTEEIYVGAKDEDLSDLWKAALDDDDLLDELNAVADPSTFFEDDGEGFLEDETIGADQAQLSPVLIKSLPKHPVYSPDGHMQGFGKQPEGSNQRTSPYTPSTQAPQRPAAVSSYYPTHTPLATGNFPSTNMPNGHSTLHQPSNTATLPVPARPPLQSSAQSFADKSKGGYTSPYDLPMDVTRPRKRAALPPARSIPDGEQVSQRPPPPRSSSMYSGAPPSQMAHPPVSSLPAMYSPPAANALISSRVEHSTSTSSFFEDLVLSSKPRPSSAMGKASVPVIHHDSPTSLPPQMVSIDQHHQEQQKIPNVPSNAQQYKLLPPERLSLYGDARPQQPPSVPVMNSRYSPAPSNISAIPSSVNRYASSPAISPRPPSAHALNNHPRTSSPLTKNMASVHQPHSYNNALSSDPAWGPSQSTSTLTESPPRRFPVHESHQAILGGDSHLNRVDEDMQSQYRPRMSMSPTISYSNQVAPPSSSPSASSHAIYTPGPDSSSSDVPAILQHASIPEPTGLARAPPQRSQTQSPSARKPTDIPPVMRPPYQRPASVNNYAPSAPHYDARKSLPSQPLIREQDQNPTYMTPSDGRELDSLERWKGCPIFSFGFGGTIVKMFPRHVPRYAAGQKVPTMKCNSGEVKIEHGKTFILEDSLVTFPGPLKAKGKKKDVLDWLEKKVRYMENTGEVMGVAQNPFANQDRRQEERLLLWKIMRILVEHDGVIEGNQVSEQAVRAVLSPELTQGDAAPIPQVSSNASLIGIHRRGESSSMHNPVNSESVEELRKLLLRGNREKAVWHAVDHRLWAHAMLLASTLEKATARQVAQEFVRQEVKTFGENTEALSALYQVFAGNWEESVDELVPPSARAGLQMVSKSAGTGPTKNALNGLDRWRETLTLILSNRTADDGKALVPLGQLLAGYGRSEAAHICYIFAKTPGLFGGPDDPQVSVALLGADHLRRPYDYGRDFDSILLTEVHDFARSTLASSSAATVSPHLQSYKLYHAMILAEYGYKFEAQQYCETIFSTLKSNTKPSPYYHSLLVSSLENLQDRLRQAPRDDSSSWISKPSIDKVSGSIWARFNQYVAGDEDDAASSNSGKVQDPAAGPFARVTGDSPTLSRAPSSSDLYNTLSPGTGRAPPTAAPPSNSRYAPAAAYAPRSSLDQQRHGPQDEINVSSGDNLWPNLAPQQYSSPPSSSANPSYGSYASPPHGSPYAPRTQSYQPGPPSQPAYVSAALTENSNLSGQQHHLSIPPAEPNSSNDHGQPSLELALANPSDNTYTSTESHAPLYEPPSSAHIAHPSEYGTQSVDYQPQSSFEPPAISSEVQDSSYEPPQYSYEPLSDGGYDPPSYNPPSYDPDVIKPESSPIEPTSKKSAVDLDGEDDFESRAAALRKEERARKDREADEAFRNAAEADAQKDKMPKLNSKKSWFGGGWFAGKDKSTDAAALNAPIKVKLGEENSFYYDEQLKKWVNKKGGASEAAAAPALPPPKGLPSRSVSAYGGPPPNSTPVPPVPALPAGMGVGGVAIRAVSGPMSSPQFASNHPSRGPSPAVNMVPTSGGASPASGLSSAPPSRPATSQGGATNIEDLIGVPQARKGGTVRKGKKGRGYVDVMAKQ